MSVVAVDLAGVFGTKLWTLHNGASEAMRPDGVLHNPDAAWIYTAIA